MSRIRIIMRVITITREFIVIAAATYFSEFDKNDQRYNSHGKILCDILGENIGPVTVPFCLSRGVMLSTISQEIWAVGICSYQIKYQFNFNVGSIVLFLRHWFRDPLNFFSTLARPISPALIMRRFIYRDNFICSAPDLFF